MSAAQLVQVDVNGVQNFVAIDGLAALKNGARDLFGGRATVARVVLDAKVAVRSAGVMADKMMPPKALYLRMTQETAGVEKIPPWPTRTFPKPLAAAILRMVWIAWRL